MQTGSGVLSYFKVGLPAAQTPNRYAGFLPGLPAELKYGLLREKWDEKVVYTGEGMTHFKFCSYESEKCPFPQGIFG